MFVSQILTQFTLIISTNTVWGDFSSVCPLVGFISPLLYPILESSSLDPLWSPFAWPSTGVVFTWPSLESLLFDPLLESSWLDLLLGSSSLDPRGSSLFDPLLESSSLDPLWNLLYSTRYWSLLVWVNLSYLQLTVIQSVSQSVSQSVAMESELT